MKESDSYFSLTGLYLLAFLRMAIGWHLLFEGLTKALESGWSAAGYLQSATGPFAGFYHMLAYNETLLMIVNFMNIWLLILAGTGLLIGFYTKLSQVIGIFLILSYYLSHPPLFMEPGFFREGSYFVVSKDFLEILSLILLMFFPTGKILGIDSIVDFYKNSFHKSDFGKQHIAGEPIGADRFRRRQVIKHLSTLPLVGVVIYAAFHKSWLDSMEEKKLVDASSGATAKYVQGIKAGSIDDLASLKGRVFTEETAKLKGKLPKAPLGNIEVSRVIMGGNLISGYAHSRDLIYVSSLVRNYHKKDRIFRTLMLAEQSGVNTLLSNPEVLPLMNEYWNEGYGNIQFISDCAGLNYGDGFHITAKPFDEYFDIVKNAMDMGATAGYIQGETADYYIEHNMVDKIVKVMDYLRQNGLTVGIGAHKIESIKKCVELGPETDFWMKTLHKHNYWSAKAPTWHDNMYCFDPEETVKFMQSLEQPWIAFKTLAAGALKPKEAFPYVFKSGADFLCVGMYDFQIINDVNIALTAIDKAQVRDRPWRA